MTITMTAKHQITIPKKIAGALDLGKGSMFNIVIADNKIELIPLETKEKVFTEAVYKKLDALSKKEAGKEKRATKRPTDNLKRGRV